MNLGDVIKATPAGLVFDLVRQVLGGLGLDPEAKERAERQAFELLRDGTFAERAENSLALAQVEANKAEAQAAGGGWMGLFRAGARPAAMWVCVAGFGVQYLVAPLLPWAVLITTGKQVPPMPALDIEAMLVLLGGLLGVGGMRHRERMAGKA